MIKIHDQHIINTERNHDNSFYIISFLEFILFLKLVENIFLILMDHVYYNFISMILSFIGIKTLKSVDRCYIITYIITELGILILKLLCIINIIHVDYRDAIVVLDIVLQSLTCFLSVKYCTEMT